MIQGWLSVDPEITTEWKAEAKELEAAGTPWCVYGFDEVAPEDVQKLLEERGVQIDESGFSAFQDTAPGPYEVAEAWIAESGRQGEEDVDFFWLAARRLWAAWLPDTPSIETEIDAIEKAIATSETALPEEKDAAALAAFQRFVQACDGDGDVADAIVFELPVNFWTWAMKRLDGVSEAHSPDSWLKVSRDLAVCFPSARIFQLAIARFLHRHDRHDDALQEVAEALKDAPSFPFLLFQGAKTFQALGLPERALPLAEQGMAGATDDGDDADGVQVLGQVLASLDRGDELQDFVARGRSDRRRKSLLRRKERKRHDKKKRRR